MKEYPMPELGYLLESDCVAIKKALDGASFMNFTIKWSGSCCNCTLIVCTDYDDSETSIKTMFLYYVVSRYAELLRRGEG